MGGYYTYRIAFYSPKKGRDKISTFASHKYDPYRKEINRLFCQLSDRPYEEVFPRILRPGLPCSGVITTSKTVRRWTSASTATAAAP